MIVVDSSVWIAALRGVDVAGTRKLARVVSDAPAEILIGDLILLEILQGARDDRHASAIERRLRSFPIEPMLDEVLAVSVARNFRLLRARGLTIRKTADLIIATFCVERGHRLMHDDRDFDVATAHLGLRAI